MKIYLKNGNIIKVSQKTANVVSARMEDGLNNLVIDRKVVSKNIYVAIVVSEVVAIK